MKGFVQSEAAECGLACIAAIASLHGNHVELHELRQRFPLSLRGARLNQLIQISHQVGFLTRALRVELEGLRELDSPCILHWDLSHFVVLLKVKKSAFVIFDPAVGERTIDAREVSRHFTGVVLELTPGEHFTRRVQGRSAPAWQIIGPIVGLRRVAAELLGLSLAIQVLLAASPILMQLVVDQVLTSSDVGRVLDFV